MHTFSLSAIPATPWKNGGGVTREIVCWPPGADMDTFDWRVSVATIRTSGPFSRFAGVDRVIALLDGAGVHLRSGDGSIDHQLTTPYEPYSFPGEREIECELPGSESRDFNVMSRRARMRSEVSIVREKTSFPASRYAVVFAPLGSWRVIATREHQLAAGTGLWWAGPAVRCELRPDAAASAASEAPLIAVRLWRVTV